MERREERIKAAEKSVLGYHPAIQKMCTECFIGGAEWADRTMIDKICEWLEKHLYDEAYIFRDNEGTWIDIESVIEDLRTVAEK
jgi:hypothetical protein